MKIAVYSEGTKKELNIDKDIATKIQQESWAGGTIAVMHRMARQLERPEVAMHLATMTDGDCAVVLDSQSNFHFMVQLDGNDISVLDVRFTRCVNASKETRLFPWLVVKPEKVEVMPFFSPGRLAAII